jgi:hypothetical protein
VVVAGKRVTALYLIPEGFEKRENAEGYVEIVKKGSDGTNAAAVDAAFDEAFEGPAI